MDKAAQNEIKNHFDRMYKAGIMPWKDHPPEPSLFSFFKNLKEERPNAKLLDIGCGDGWISIKAAHASFEVWGIDGSDTAITSARKKAKEEGVREKIHFEVGDALALPYEKEFFDALVDRGLFHHILPRNRPIYLDNILRVLKKKSFMYLTVFSDKNPLGIGQLFTKEKIIDIFGPYFSATSFYEDPFPTKAPAHLLHFFFERNG